MANYTENFNSKLDWAMPFQRTGAFPIDRTSLFSSYTDAVKYAAGNPNDPDSRGLCGSSYGGQTITVVENDTVEKYDIQPDRSLKKVGSSAASDSEIDTSKNTDTFSDDAAVEGKLYYVEIV